MGFFDFFKSLFGGAKPKLAPEELNIDITESVMTINGNAVDIPCHIDVLKGMLGKPRRQTGERNVNFKWDELGIRCYTKGNSVVDCIGIKTKRGDTDTKFDPKCDYKGVLTIEGKPWEEVMHGGEDLEVARQRDLGGLSLFSEYADFEKGDSEGCRGAYSGVEVSIPMSANEMRSLVEKK